MGERRSTSIGSRLTVVSLFSGCGGLDLGFKGAGFEVAYACDHDAAAVQCYARNLDKGVHLRDVTSDEFHRDIDNIGECDVVLGGFPCQGFSKSGPKRASDPRNTLYVEMHRAVERLRPRVFVAENVDGLHQNFGGAFLTRITQDFARIGYEVEHRILQAASFGLPQYRRRIVFVGVRSGESDRFTWPVPTHNVKSRNGEFEIDADVEPETLWSSTAGLTLKAPETIGGAIGDLLELTVGVADHVVTNSWPVTYEYIFRAIGEGQKLCNVRHAPSSVYTWQIPQVFGETDGNERLVLETISKNRRRKRYGAIPNGNPLSTQVIASLSGLSDVPAIAERLVRKKYLKEIEGKFDLTGAMFCSGLFKRPRWDEPSPTVLTVFDNPRYFLHPRRPRPFSVRECARLQGFPDDFLFCRDNSVGAIKDAYRLIGNAVPPPLAMRIAASVRELFTAGEAGARRPRVPA